MRADEGIRRKHLTEEEIEELRTASGRLDKLLAKVAEDEEARRKEIREGEIKQLRVASSRLDQLLTEAGKGITTDLKLRRRRNSAGTG